MELISKFYLKKNGDSNVFVLFSNIKLFSPLAETPIDDADRINRTVKRNHAMMEETSSTITVPATFIYRMLTSIYRLRYSEETSIFNDDD